jgi:hypothetical protein
MPDTITHGLVDPLKAMGFPTSAGVRTDDCHVLYAIFDQHSRRVMIVGHPDAQGDMAAVALAAWSAGRPPCAGDLLDELVDPRNAEAVRLALQLLRDGRL